MGDSVSPHLLVCVQSPFCVAVTPLPSTALSDEYWDLYVELCSVGLPIMEKFTEKSKHSSLRSALILTIQHVTFMALSLNKKSFYLKKRKKKKDPHISNKVLTGTAFFCQRPIHV